MLRLLVRLLPRITARAQDDCGYQYRCLTSGPCKIWQRRKLCPGYTGPWQSIGCCGGSCC